MFSVRTEEEGQAGEEDMSHRLTEVGRHLITQARNGRPDPGRQWV